MTSAHDIIRILDHKVAACSIVAMPKKGKKSNERLDKYYYLAKEQGYRARSAFKLMQLNKKFDFLSRARALVDLCAAPGGWLQVAQKHMPVSSIIIGVDLVPIKPIPNVITFTEDITTQQCRASIKKALKNWKADVVLHDGSPNVGQSWAQDAYTQSELVLAALRLATEVLAPNGWFVTKVFRSKDYNALMQSMSALFRRVSATKPAASRNASAEIFVVCEGFKPKKVDTTLTDPKSVFAYASGEAAAQPGAPLQRLSEHAKAQGYDDDASQLLERKISVSEFLESSDPLKVLTTATSLVFDDTETSKFAKQHKETRIIEESFNDIRLLGKTDFKRILRWRGAVKKDLAARDAVPAEKKGRETEEEKQARLEREMDERVKTLERAEKRRQKKQAEREKRQHKRVESQVAESGEIGTDATQELFTLENMPSGETDVAPDVVLTDDEGDKRQAERIEELRSKKGSHKRKRLNPDDPDVLTVDGDTRTEVLEEQLDELYDKYRETKIHGGKRVQVHVGEGKKRSVVVPTVRDRDNFMAVDKLEKPAPLEEFKPDFEHDPLDFSEEKPGRSSLLVDLDDAPPESAAKKADSWFSGGAFEDLGLEELGGEDEEAAPEAEDAVMSAHEDAAGDADAAPEPAKKRQRPAQVGDAPAADYGGRTQISAPRTVRSRLVKGESFEVVPAVDPGDYELMDESDDGIGDDAAEYADEGAAGMDEDSEGDSTDEEADGALGPQLGKEKLAKMLVLGQKIALSKRARARLEDDAYNRYAFADEELPEWFATDEKRHTQPQMPVTREQVDAMKEKLMAINARPMHKVAEAEGRKRKRAMAKLQRMKVTQMAIEASTELNAQEKARTVSRMYKRAANKKKGTILVDGKSKQRIGGAKAGRKKLVDARLKKDSRGQQRAKKKVAKAAKGHRASMQRTRQTKK